MAGHGVDRGSGSSSGGTNSVISESLIDAKGDLIVGTADNTAVRKAVGANETRLVADSAQADGLKYVADTTNYAVAAKGDLLAGTAADTVAPVTVGANETRLVADSAQATGLKYVADTTNYAVAAKGDLLVGTAADTVAPVTVGADDTALLADASQSAGVRWGNVPSATVRQTQLAGPLDSSGYNATISAGAALNFNVNADPDNVVLTFANGFGAGGAVDTYTQLTADASNQGSLNASNTHYIHATRVSASSVTWGQSLIPPQYGYAFDRTQGALLNFEAADASTTMVDAFGNTWTASGNAQIDTAQFKFGTASLLLDGTGDWITTSNITSLGDGSWEISVWFRLNALPGAGNVSFFFSGRNAAGFGIDCGLFNNAGTTRLYTNLSSTGSSANLANAATGTNTVWALNQWNKIRFVFDALAGTYRMYLSLNGAAETQDYTLSSSAKLCAITAFRLGATADGGTSPLNGWLDGFRFIPCATATTTETPSASAPAITDYPVHFFSIPQMKMYEVTAASESAGVNPTMTQVNRVFVAEADTGAGTVSAVRNYALRGRYVSAWAAIPAAGSLNSHTDNIGLSSNVRVRNEVMCKTAESGYVPGDVIVNAMDYYNPGADIRSGVGLYKAGRNTTKWETGATGVGGMSAAGGTFVQFFTNFLYRIITERTW